MKPFLSGRPHHDQPALARDAATGAGLARLHAAHSVTADRAGPAVGPSVECVKQGDKVVRLIVTCTCGERIEIDCMYPNAS
jgi:hypothetical protein